MSKSRVLTGVLSAVFVLTLASSARADMVHADMFLEKMIFAERHKLAVSDVECGTATAYLYAEHFENNNGKHLGFSMATKPRTLGPGLGKNLQQPEVSQNPEPTAMVLLGTGLTAAGALARRKNRKRVKR
jgi:hypothetical protein